MQEEQNKKVNYRIGALAIVLLVALAGIFDLLSLIPFVGDIVGPIFWIIASIYFWKAGLGLVNGKRLATAAISLIAELIPAVQELPMILAGIVAIIIMTRIEDKTGISLNPLSKKPGVTPPRNQRRPANVDGVRLPRNN
ncbi:MAG TPA: hypothetical protein VJI66_02790 [Candidatus Paceibacterota bacterium]